MARKKRESVTVSYHYLLRQKVVGKELENVSFTTAEFDKLFDTLNEQIEPDLGDPLTLEKVRSGYIIPFSDLSKKDDRTFTGTFRAPYSGHSFNNSEKGIISAESVNQRRFQFLAYLSPGGRLYVGAQYLGNYGGWTALAGALKRELGEASKIASFSFRNDAMLLAKAIPTEVKVRINRPNAVLEKDTRISKKAWVALEATDSDDDNFEKEAKEKFIPLLGQSPDKVKRALSEAFTNDGLVEIEEKDIEDCVLIANIDGKKKTLYFVDNLNIASRFELGLAVGDDGHPDPKETRDKMYDFLRDQIIAKLGKGE